MAQGTTNLVSAGSMTQVYQGSRKCTKHTWLLKQPFMKTQLSNQHHRAKGFSFLFFFSPWLRHLDSRKKKQTRKGRTKPSSPARKKDNIIQLSESDTECGISCFWVLSHYPGLRSSTNLSCLFHYVDLQYGESLQMFKGHSCFIG